MELKNNKTLVYKHGNKVLLLLNTIWVVWNINNFSTRMHKIAHNTIIWNVEIVFS